MKKYLIVLVVTFSFFSSCSFFSNGFKFGDTTKVFMENLVHKNYKKCISLMASNPQIPSDSLIAPLNKFSDVVVEHFGDKLNYSFVKAQKKFGDGADMPPNSTMVLVEYNNGEYVGLIQALFDDNSGKILNIKTLDIKQPIPSMVGYWLFGLVALCIPAFIIYMIVLIKRSDMRRKWLKYFFVILINVPAISYKAVGGLSILFLNFQLLFGISFLKEGYLNSYWIFGIPIGGLIVLWKLKTGNYKSNKITVDPEEPKSVIDSEESSPDVEL